MSPYFIRNVQFYTPYVEIVIGDANDENFSLSLRLTADDLKNAFDKETIKKDDIPNGADSNGNPIKYTLS